MLFYFTFLAKRIDYPELKFEDLESVQLYLSGSSDDDDDDDRCVRENYVKPTPIKIQADRKPILQV